MSTGRSAKERATQAKKLSATDEYRLAVGSYVAAGADERVQQVITAVHRLSRRLNQWYDAQLADLNVSAGEWSVLSELARSGGEALTPGQLAAAASVAPSSMTHRLDRMLERGLVSREADPSNRTRVLVRLSHDGWGLFAAAIKGSNLVESELLAALRPAQVTELTSLLEQMLAGLDDL